MADSTDQKEERYSGLCDRAVGFVESRGGAVPEEMLIEHVFGNTGSAALWRPLLRNVLGEDDRITFRSTGEWVLAAGDAPLPLAATLLDEFVAIDVETTGLKPSRNRVIEVAAIRYRHGERVQAFESLVDPGVPIPTFIQRLTTITPEHMTDAPAFADIAQDLNDFISDSLLIGHNVQFDIGFLNAEFGRVGIDPMVNERLDTMGMAVKLLKSVKKPSLDRVADAVGLNPRKVHRAGGDAALTAEVALRLTAEAERQGVRSLTVLKAMGYVTEPRVRDDVGRARAVMDRSLAHALPKKPGCYLMRDARGEVVYVGKAKNLRERVSSYYSQPIGYTRKMDGLIEAVKQIDHVVVGSELEALLLESQLIRRLHPRYNTALKRSEHYPFIKVDVTNPWPRIMVCKHRSDDGARYFGPYKSAASARRTVDVINSVLPLRTCTRSFKNARSYGKPCIALDLKQCVGPCTGQANHDTYRSMVDAVIRFLDGKDDALHQTLLVELQEAAERLDFEKAERIRKSIRSVTAILDEQTRLNDAQELHNLLVVLPSAAEGHRELLLVLHGVLWAQFRVRHVEVNVDLADDDDAVISDDADLADIASRLGRSLERAGAATIQVRERLDVDQTSILNRFLFKHAGHPALVAIPLTNDGIIGAWALDLTVRAMQVSDDDLTALDAAVRQTASDATDATDSNLHVGDDDLNLAADA